MANFQYAYNRSELLTSNQLQNATKPQLLKEARRLQRLVSTRQKQIEKRGYSSYALERLRVSQETIKQGTAYDGNMLGVSSGFTEVMLQDIIRDFDTFLKSETSTYQGIEKRTPKDKKMTSKIEFYAGRTLDNKDWAKINYILDNSDNVENVIDLLGSTQVMSLIANAEETAGNIIERIEDFFASSKDEYSIEELEDIFKKKE